MTNDVNLESKLYVEFIPVSFLEANHWQLYAPGYSLIDSLRKRPLKILRANILRIVPVYDWKTTWYFIDYREPGKGGGKDLYGFFGARQVPEDILSLAEKPISQFVHFKRFLFRGLRALPYSVLFYVTLIAYLLCILEVLAGSYIFDHPWTRSILGLNQCDFECLKAARIRISNVLNFSTFCFFFLVLPIPLAIFLRKKTQSYLQRRAVLWEAAFLTCIGLFIIFKSVRF